MSGCNPQNERIEQLFREMFKTLYIYAKNALGEHSLAEDATQETFCTACAKSDECLQSGNPEGWLMKTLKNVVRNTKRQRAKLNMLAVISLNSEESELLATYDEIDIDVLYGDEAKREDFQIFKMVAVEGRSMRETADEFGISIEACKKRVQRIKKRLQKKLSKE